ncbi:MAG: MarR family winged helix-turn-helix transcriptional regulator [Cetobacterium sp.]|uniref:MarR family winged helix-turn-helix transcriptional regulator n=1 Tax=Cetobacterium sp. TaxID=2071632 RepID=UPI003F3BF7FB
MGYEICIVARKIHQKLSLKFRDYDITPEQWVVLKELSNEDKISQNEISLRVGKDKNNIKALIDKLEKKEYVIRQQDTNDKRAFLIILTDKAYLLIEELKDIDKAFNEEISQNLNQSELEQFKLLLDKFKKNL